MMSERDVGRGSMVEGRKEAGRVREDEEWGDTRVTDGETNGARARDETRQRTGCGRRDEMAHGPETRRDGTRAGDDETDGARARDDERRMAHGPETTRRVAHGPETMRDEARQALLTRQN